MNETDDERPNLLKVIFFVRIPEVLSLIIANPGRVRSVGDVKHAINGHVDFSREMVSL